MISPLGTGFAASRRMRRQLISNVSKRLFVTAVLCFAVNSYATPELNLLARHFAEVRREAGQTWLFATRATERSAVLIFGDGRVVGYIDDRWFDVTQTHEEQNDLEGHYWVWSAPAVGLVIRLQPGLRKLYNPGWALLGSVSDYRTDDTIDNLYAVRNHRLTSLAEAKRALTEEYMGLVNAGATDVADQLLAAFPEKVLTLLFVDHSTSGPSGCSSHLN